MCVRKIGGEREIDGERKKREREREIGGEKESSERVTTSR